MPHLQTIMTTWSFRQEYAKDKALVKNAVRQLYRDVYSKIAGLKFNNLEALNIEILKHTDTLNNRKMYNCNYTAAGNVPLRLRKADYIFCLQQGLYQGTKKNSNSNEK